MYKLLKDYMGGEPCIVIRLTDGTNIPFAPANTDYQEYLTWVAKGNEPLPADE